MGALLFLETIHFTGRLPYNPELGQCTVHPELLLQSLGGEDKLTCRPPAALFSLDATLHAASKSICWDLGKNLLCSDPRIMNRLSLEKTFEVMKPNHPQLDTRNTLLPPFCGDDRAVLHHSCPPAAEGGPGAHLGDLALVAGEAAQGSPRSPAGHGHALQGQGQGQGSAPEQGRGGFHTPGYVIPRLVHSAQDREQAPLVFSS